MLTITVAFRASSAVMTSPVMLEMAHAILGLAEDLDALADRVNRLTDRLEATDPEHIARAVAVELAPRLDAARRTARARRTK